MMPTPPPARTSRLARLAPILVFAILPAVGILFLGWDWREVLVLYWLENVSLGLAMVIRMLRAARLDASDGEGAARGIFLTVFFCIHYGMFTLVHGIFVFVIVGGAFDSLAGAANGRGPAPDPGPLDWPSLLVVAAVGAVLHVAVAIAGPPPVHRGQRLMMTAYPRIFVLHIAILGGSFLIVFLGLPSAAALLLVALHAIVDVVGFLVGDRRAPAPAPLDGEGPRHSR